MIERKILIGLITSTEFCKKIKDFWNPRLIESATAKKMAEWVWEYFDKYEKSPGRDIETIFYSKAKDPKMSKSLVEEIETEILPGLSEEYTSEGFEIQPALDEASKYFTEQHIKLHVAEVQSLLTQNKVEEAEKKAREFKPLEISLGKLDQFILSVSQIKRKEVIKPKVLMKPWLKEGQTTIIYGNFGSGKSLLTMLIAYLLGLEKYDEDECLIGEWEVKHPCGTLYLDGEIGEQEMVERFEKFKWVGRQGQETKVKILSLPEYQLATDDTFYLSSRPNQLKIIQWLRENPAYKLIVLDSASTLFGLIEENDNSEWNNKINPFLRDLRALGVACILLHHAGKDNKRGLRGASAMGAMAHNIFRLTPHPDKDFDAGEAWFNLTKDKQRAGGKSFKQFSLRFTLEDNEKETHWRLTKNE